MSGVLAEYCKRCHPVSAAGGPGAAEAPQHAHLPTLPRARSRLWCGALRAQTTIWRELGWLGTDGLGGGETGLPARIVRSQITAASVEVARA
jgi:hypothetical protein